MTMKVALIQCPWWGLTPPLGPAALKAFLDAHGHEAKCFDFNIECYGDLLSFDKKLTSVWEEDAWRHWELDFSLWNETNPVIRFQRKSTLNDFPFPLEKWTQAVLSYHPDVVGFTVHHTSLKMVLDLARELKRRNHGLRVVFGGPEMTKEWHGPFALETGIPDVVVEGEVGL